MDNEKKYSSDDIKKFFGEKLKKLRQNAGMTRKELAKKLSITEISVGNYERGLREPSLEKLIVLSNLFCVSIEELIGYDESIFKNKLTEIYRSRFFSAVIITNGFDIVKTVDGEFVLGNDRDLSSLMYFAIGIGTELSNEMIFFKSLDNLKKFVDYLIFESLLTSRTFTENFSHVINTKSSTEFNIIKIYKQVSEELASKLKNGKIYYG